MLPALLLLAGIAAPALGRTVHSVIVFSRHGDREPRMFRGYQATNLGANQAFDSGSFYRDRYVADGAVDQIAGISANSVIREQIWATAPDEHLLFQTAANFLQGLYPPLADIDAELVSQTLANGSSVSGPLDGYQYVHIHGVSTEEPDTIWRKGDDQCPAWNAAARTYRESAEYNNTLESTEDFYANLVPLLGDIMGAENVTFARAYDVFDLLHTASIHNGSLSDADVNLIESNLNQSRYLADEWEWNMNYNASEPDRSIGGESFAGGILNQMNNVVNASVPAGVKFSMMAGSYDTFLAFFGIMDLASVSSDFMGLPHYASTMAFELFSEADNAEFPAEDMVDSELRVRWLFRNGTEDDAELTAYPLFGQSETELTYGDFVGRMSERAVVEVSDWCARCGSQAGFCVAALADEETTEAVLSGESVASESGSDSDSHSSSGSGSGSGLSNNAAGGIGAGVTLAVVGLLGLVAWALFGRKKPTPGPAGGNAGKGVSDSESV